MVKDAVPTCSAPVMPAVRLLLTGMFPLTVIGEEEPMPCPLVKVTGPRLGVGTASQGQPGARVSVKENGPPSPGILAPGGETIGLHRVGEVRSILLTTAAAAATPSGGFTVNGATA